MSQEMNQAMPVRRSGASTAIGAGANAVGGGAWGAIKGLALGFFAAPLTFGVVGLAIGAALGGVAAIFTASLATVASAALITGALFGTIGLAWSVVGASLGATLGGIMGGVKGAERSVERAREQTAAANELDAQLQAAAMDAQARMATAQAKMIQHNPRAYAPPHHEVAPQFNQASPTIQASNDNQVHGTVAQAPERAASI